MDKKHHPLTPHERERYNRQILIPGWGEEGQEKIRDATVFIAGAGGLGSPAALYLAAAGVGCIRICDCGKVELSNLNRQILHVDRDISRRKADSAEETLRGVNPLVKVIGLKEKIDRKSIDGLVAGAQIIVDAADNYETRYVLNEFSIHKGIPFIHAGLYAMSGQITFIHSPDTPCLRCIFPQAPPPETFPIVGATAGIIGSMEALEALKYLAGIPNLLKNKLLIMEGNPPSFQEIIIERDPECLVCGDRGNS